MLESKQLKAKVLKSKYVVIGPRKLRTECLKRAEKNPIKMGDYILENFASEKYLGDKIHEHRTAAGITETNKNQNAGSDCKK